MKARPRIQLDPAQSGLNAGAFAGLSLPDLPAGPEPAAPVAGSPVGRRGRVVLRRETAHRGGKAVIVVHDFAAQIAVAEIELLAKKLRGACGCGGTVQERTIELQGEQTAKIRALLESEGYQVAGVR